MRAEAREAERIKEEDERKKMEQERAALRARRLMEREGLLRRFRACYVMSHERNAYPSSAIACIQSNLVGLEVTPAKFHLLLQLQVHPSTFKRLLSTVVTSSIQSVTPTLQAALMLMKMELQLRRNPR